MAKTKIAWCDEVWNPFWGCHRGCPYCYARNFARRFGKTERERAFLPCVKSLDFPKFRKATQRVFVGSMSDPEYWEPAWWHMVVDVVRSYPDVDFIFLTKGEMTVYQYIRGAHLPNVILGLTRTTVEAMRTMRHPDALDMDVARWLLNIEPIQEPMNTLWCFSRALCLYDWVIVGAETGNRKDKPEPGWDWFSHLVHKYKAINCAPAVFMKPSIHHLAPDGKVRMEFPGRSQ